MFWMSLDTNWFRIARELSNTKVSYQFRVAILFAFAAAVVSSF